jgi:DNA polymerase bacteriophage-type
MPILHFDFETRSAADLEAVGAYQYASHPSSDVWCCAYSVDAGEVKLWRRGDPVPKEFVEATRNPEWTFAAHNLAFERLIVRDIMAPRYGWPLLPDERLCCTMARALSLALPGKLENVAKALGLEHQKDAAGARLMREMSRPRDPQAGEDPNGIYWQDDPEKIERLHRYCVQDVETERALHRRIGFLPPAEQRVWEHNLLVNDRGLYIDGDLLDTGLRAADELEAEIKRAIADVTAGKVTSIHQTQRVLTWLEENGHKVENARKPTLQKELANGSAPPEAKRVMELRLDGASAAVKKLRRFQNWRGTDGRARGAMYYHGGATGRWSSKGIQLQNLKKPATDDLGAVISGKIENLSDAADLGRAVICAGADRRFLLADFSGVESRIGAWVAGESSKAKQWKRFDDTGDPKTEPYYILGLKFGLPEDTARKIGKVADLAFLYCGSIGAWRNLSKDDGRSDKDILSLRDLWRNAHPNIVRMWKTCERAALRAMHNPGATIPAGKLSFRYDGEFFLFMRLPSGRELAYPEPRLITDKFGREAIIFKDNANGKFVDCRHGQGAFGGTWFQNAVQAIARDILAEALLRLEAAGYPVVLHIHDEVVCEVPNGVGTLEEFAKLMTTLAAWADGLPIAIGKPRNGQRFAKIKAPDAAEPIPARRSDANSTPEPEIVQSFSQMPPKRAEEVIVEPPITPHIADAPPTAPGFDADSAQAAEDWFRKKANGNGRDASTGAPGKTDGYPHGEDEPAGGKQAAEFIYKSADGTEVLKVRKIEIFNSGGVRIDKRFPQAWKVNGHWVSKKPKGWVPIPYRLPEFLAAPPDAVIDIFEGEKDADRGAALGLVATCNPEGAGKWVPELNEYFRGRHVRIHEDNDDAGRKHVPKVAASLKGVVKESLVVRYPELDEHGDFSDFMSRGGTIKAMIERAKPIEAPATKLVQSSAEFVIGFVPPDYLIVGWLQRRFVYSFTAATGAGKTAIALLLTLLVSRGLPLGKLEVKRGRVLYFAGENPDDVRMRWMATTAQFELTPEDIDNVFFVPGVFKFTEISERVREEMTTRELALVVVDTSAAYFETDDENNNVQALAHAKRLRELSRLPGGPMVLICCHPTKNAEVLHPRGGGAFLNEVDGNLTAVRDDQTVQVHWEGKFRGTEFPPLDFRLDVVLHDRLHDSDDNPIRTVVAGSLDETGLQQMKADSRQDQDVVLLSIEEAPELTQRARARHLNWMMTSGEPYQVRVGRAEKALKSAGLIKQHRGQWELTEKGKREVKQLLKQKG